MFSTQAVDSFNDAYRMAWALALDTKEVERRLLTKQRGVPIENRKTWNDVSLAVNQQMIDAFRPWLNNIKEVDVTNMKRVEADFYSCHYEGEMYLVVHVSSLNIVSFINTMMVVREMNPNPLAGEFLMIPLFIGRVGSKSGDPTHFAEKGDLLAFYTYSEDVQLPFDLKNKDMAYFVYILKYLWQSMLDMPYFTVYTIRGEMKILPHTLYKVEKMSLLSYELSVDFLADQSPKIRSLEEIKEGYINEALKFANDYTVVYKMAKAFDCLTVIY